MPTPSAPLGSLDGPSRTIIVEPLRVPVPVPPKRIDPEPAPPAPAR